MATETEEAIRHVAVLGAGTMGGGIAHVAALARYDVTLFDVTIDLANAGLEKIRASLEAGITKGKVSPADRDRALAAITTSGSLEEAVTPADLVIEAAPEDLDMKREIFRKLGACCRESALLATNTSSLSVSKIASAVPHPE